MAIPDVLPLTSAATLPGALVGGKARGFATLTGAGLPVPEGFVITTLAYRVAGAEGGGGTLPGRLARRIAAALEPLGDDPVAVRSSACGEDGTEHSFAGQYATVLGARGLAEVTAAVVECWASARGQRAVAYAGNGAGAPMAVIVQRLVEPEAAGIVFTADPVTGDRGTVVVNASYGLGEAVVSGVVTPDDYRLAREDGRILGVDVGDKDLMLVWDGAGVREVLVPEAHRTARALDDGALEAVRRGALACEGALGRPVDCEFCVAGGRVTWVQCRPLTALPEPTKGMT